MKISKTIVDYIRTTAKIAKTIGIDSVAYEKGIIRAMDENKSIIICQTENIPEFPFDGIGINRLDTFFSRLLLIEGKEGFEVEAEIHDKNNLKQVSRLIIKAKNVETEFRCANTSTIKAPKQVKDPMKCYFAFPTEAADILIKAQTAMEGANFVTFISNVKDNKTKFELIDSNNDVFVFSFAESAKLLVDDKPVNFVHRYPIKVLNSLLKQERSLEVQVSENGILKVNVMGINVYVIPSV